MICSAASSPSHPASPFPVRWSGGPSAVSHGTADPVLPIDACSRQLVPALVEAGYAVTYEEFDGGHTVPPVVADKAFAWWAGAVPR